MQSMTQFVVIHTSKQNMKAKAANTKTMQGISMHKTRKAALK